MAHNAYQRMIRHRGVTLRARRSGGRRLRHSGGCEYYGAAASHSGFKSEACVDFVDRETVASKARGMIDHYLKTPFLVGRDDCVMWKTLSGNAESGWIVRLPYSGRGAVCDWLLGQGFVWDSPHNNELRSPEGIAVGEFKRWLRPLLEAGGRAKSEDALVKQLTPRPMQQVRLF